MAAIVAWPDLSVTLSSPLACAPIEACQFPRARPVSTGVRRMTRLNMSKETLRTTRSDRPLAFSTQRDTSSAKVVLLPLVKPPSAIGLPPRAADPGRLRRIARNRREPALRRRNDERHAADGDAVERHR